MTFLILLVISLAISNFCSTFAIAQTPEVGEPFVTELSFKTLPTVTIPPGGHSGSVNTTALWENIGSLNGVDLDMVVTILSNTKDGVVDSVKFSTNTSQPDNTADEARIQLVNGVSASDTQKVTVKFNIYKAGTFQAGSGESVDIIPSSLFQDLDSVETIFVQESDVARTRRNGKLNVQNQVENDTDVAVVNENPGLLKISSSADGNPGDKNIAIEVFFKPASEFEITFETTSDTRNFEFDGNAEAFFANPFEVKVDNDPPAPPTFNNVVAGGNQSPVFQGTAEAFATVQLEVNNKTFIRVADKSGDWIIDTATTPPDNGTLTFVNGTDTTYPVQVTTFDAAGNSSSLTKPDGLTFDKKSPVVTIIDSLDPANIENEDSYPVSGNCEAGDGNVLVSISGISDPPQSVPCSSGSWDATFDVSGAPEGPVGIRVNISQTDNFDNLGTDSATALKGTAVPSISINNNGTEGDSVYNATEITTNTISGTTANIEDNQVVSIQISDSKTTINETATVTGNAWTISNVNLSGLGEEAVTLSVSVSSLSGNKATDSDNLSKDSGNPVLTVLSPSGESNENLPNFSGITDQPVGEEVFIKDGSGAAVCTATVSAGSPNNTWSCKAPTAIAQGTYNFTADTTDTSGNQTTTPISFEVDFDQDDDGIPDVFEGSGDSDNDGIPNNLDDDSDNDGIKDSVEFGTPLDNNDSDNDGIDDAIDVTNTGGTDSNNNGIDDTKEATDSDNDGKPDYLDMDSDNDGIIDKLEIGPNPGNPRDTDGDKTPDYRDIDSDNDGLPDSVEVTTIPAFSDTDEDSDGIDDAIDHDVKGTTQGNDDNGNGVADAFEPNDSDNDGKPDYIDADSDNDLIPDKLENGLSGTDADGDGIDDSIDVTQTNGKDENKDGVDDAFKPKDTDSDKTPDYLDTDTDNDGIPDKTELNEASTADDDDDGLIAAFDNDDNDAADITIKAGATAHDEDGDGAPNFQDLDSDNDSILDVIEAGLTDIEEDGFADDGNVQTNPPDKDNDGKADFIDVRNDENNTNDIDGTDAKALDENGDGRIDVTQDTDKDGVPDVNDPEKQIFGTNLDFDGDKVSNSVDKDDDNDGIPDKIEAPNGQDIDTDGDGIPDRLDLDSDNDGIPDTIEGTGSDLLDPNQDGRIDNFVDTDKDGLVDTISDDMTPVNTDNTDNPDFQDGDSDNDGISDTNESTLTGTDIKDENNDGKIDSTTDSDNDGLVDVVDTDNGGKIPGIPDTDNDGSFDYLDEDSDGDGISDNIESSNGEDFNADKDGNGVPDRLQNDGALETAVNGFGSIGYSIFWLLGLLFISQRQLYRNNNMAKLGLSCLLLIMLPMAQAASMKGQEHFYIGGGIGWTHIEPEGESNGWRTVDDTDFGWNVKVGYDLHPHWFAELSYTDAGDAMLGNKNPQVKGNPDISYEIPALFGGYWFFEPENEWNLYFKLGLSSIQNEVNDSRVRFNKESKVQLAGGIGGHWQFSERFFLRLEIDSFDKDANYAGVLIGGYFGE
ncbi:outer membrane beta-barrel protein [Algicola sagamiensis]|uniref:outer membrane beta-barrel protein n=1 Tax=Algicola sagamiensis TaxID=163869 RepID=UPI001B7FC98F|nr:outer membrane beta-barrel protein [Algicola sagamiensis]